MQMGNRPPRPSQARFCSASPAGLLWAPCAGPILGLVLTGAALQGANVGTTLLLLAYSAGAATSLALALLIGGRVFSVMKQSLGAGEWVRRGLGAAVIAGVVAVGLGADTGLLARLSSSSTGKIEQALIDAANTGNAGAAAASNGMMAASTTRQGFRSNLPVEGQFPSLDGAVEWLNSSPLTNEQLRGKVVLVDFWTYSCINCIRTVPYIRAWAEKYKDQGLVVIGVHSPEFAFEKRSTTSNGPSANFRLDILLPSTMISGSGGHFRTAIGRPSISSMPKVRSVTTISEKASTMRPNR